MLTAILADIHGNREAFDAVVAAAEQAGAQRFVILGDLVGYGADPAYIVEQAMAMAQAGAVVIAGNHDQAVDGAAERMNDYARLALEWTRERLSGAHKDFLRELPMTHADGDTLYVHSEASRPSSWTYVACAEEAERSLNAVDSLVTFCGHVHLPQLYNMTPSGKAQLFVPKSSTPATLVASRQWLAVMGSVGQPRDGDPRAAFALYDDSRRMLTYRRVAYDIESAAQKIKQAGLPAILSARLYVGR